MIILLRTSPRRFGSPGSANPILTDLASLESLNGCLTGSRRDNRKINPVLQ
jgi:hypothetical protein